MSTAFRAISLVNCPKFFVTDGMEALISSPIFSTEDPQIFSGLFRISNEVMNTTKAFGNKILLAAKSHPVVAVVVAVIAISGIVWYVCERRDFEDEESLEAFRRELSDNEPSDQSSPKDFTDHRNSSTHPLKGGSIKVAYPKITSDRNTQKRVLGVCCICLDLPADTLTLPCKHRAMCSQCFSSRKISVCPIDRQKIEDCLKIV